MFAKGYTPWNKGITKNTDQRMADASKNMKGRTSWNKGLTKVAKQA